MEDRSPEISGVHEFCITRMSHLSCENKPRLTCLPARLHITHRLGHRRYLDPSLSHHAVHAHLPVPIFPFHLLRCPGFQRALPRLSDPGRMSHLPSSRPSMGLHYPRRFLWQPQSARPRYRNHKLGPRYRRRCPSYAGAVGSTNGHGQETGYKLHVRAGASVRHHSLLSHYIKSQYAFTLLYLKYQY